MKRTETKFRQWLIALVPPIALFSVMIFCLYGSGATSLFDRPLSLDEFHTLLVAGDPSLSHSWNSLRQGADYNPPALYILIKITSAILGRLDDRSMRVFSFASVYLGLMGVYYLLRETSLKSVAAVGTLATLAHPLLILHAFDARFYGPWFAAAAWYCVLLNKPRWLRKKSGIVSPLATSVASIILCTIHYFGIISWFLITVSHFTLTMKTRRPSYRDALWVFSGPIALLLSLIIFYPGQRSAISVPTWVSKPGFSHVQDFLVTLFPALIFAVPGLLALIDALIRELFQSRTNPSRSTEDFPLGRLAGATGLTLMPFAILGFTFLIQPAAIARYAMPSLLVVGPVIAFSLRSTGRMMAALAALAFILLALINFAFCYRSYLNHESLDVVKAIQIVRSRETGISPVMILSNQREIAYQLWRYAPQLRDVVKIIDPSDIKEGSLANYDRLERDVASRLNHLYGTPEVIRLKDLRQVATIYLLISRFDADKIADKLPDYQRQVVYNQRVTCLRLSK